MEIETIFTDSKWRILTELSHKSQSPTELSEKTGTSLPNISTQLKLLEALDFVEKQKTDNYEKGQPRKLYSMKKEFAYVVLGTKTAIGKKLFILNEESKFFFSALLLNDPSLSYTLIKLFMKHEDLIKTCEVFGYIGLKNNVYDVLIILEDPSKADVLKNNEISRNGLTYHINPHIHTKDSFINGINSNDPYFKSVLKKVYILVDKDNFLSSLKKGET